MARILLVDDTEFHLHIAREILKTAGHAVSTAPNGLKALDQALLDPPDLIVSDVVMPIMDGWELCEMVRSHPGTTALPFVFLTSMATPPHRVKGLTMGADAYLEKPVSGPLLLSTVEEVLERATAARTEAMAMGLGKGLGVRDLLVIFLAYKKTGTVTVTAPGVARGKVYFREGSAFHATTGRLLGLAAVEEMLQWDRAVLLVEPLPAAPVERTLEAPIDALLLGDLKGRPLPTA